MDGKDITKNLNKLFPRITRHSSLALPFADRADTKNPGQLRFEKLTIPGMGDHIVAGLIEWKILQVLRYKNQLSSNSVRVADLIHYIWVLAAQIGDHQLRPLDGITD